MNLTYGVQNKPVSPLTFGTLTISPRPANKVRFGGCCDDKPQEISAEKPDEVTLSPPPKKPTTLKVLSTPTEQSHKLHHHELSTLAKSTAASLSPASDNEGTNFKRFSSGLYQTYENVAEWLVGFVKGFVVDLRTLLTRPASSEKPEH